MKKTLIYVKVSPVSESPSRLACPPSHNGRSACDCVTYGTASQIDLDIHERLCSYYPRRRRKAAPPFTRREVHIQPHAKQTGDLRSGTRRKNGKGKPVNETSASWLVRAASWYQQCQAAILHASPGGSADSPPGREE